jgi:WD40 repeat protein
VRPDREAFLSAHDGAIQALTMTRDGSFVASFGSDLSLKLWDSNTGAELRNLPAPTQRAIPRYDPLLINLFPADERDVIAVLYPHDNVLRALRVSADRSSEPPLCHDLIGHESRVVAVGLSRDGSRMISVSEDNIGIFWDLTSGTESGRVNIQREPRGKLTLQILQERVLAVSWTENDSDLTVWDSSTRSVIHCLKGQGGFGTSVAISRDLKRMASASNDRTCKLWDLDQGVLLATYTAENHQYTCCLSEMAHIIGLGDWLGNVEFLRIR